MRVYGTVEAVRLGEGTFTVRVPATQGAPDTAYVGFLPEA